MKMSLSDVVFKNRINHGNPMNYQSWKVRAMIAISEGLKHMHDQNMLHRDIKPDNIMIGPGNSKEEADARLVDFGLSTPSKDGEVKGLAGTPWFMAPEIMNNKSYDSSVDIYALGITFYLFLRNEDIRLIYSQDRSRISLIIFDHIEPYQGLLQAMVTTTPAKRPNIDQVIEALTLIQNKEDSGFPKLKIQPYMSDLEKCTTTDLLNQEMLRKNRKFIKYSRKTFSGKDCRLIIQAAMRNGQYQRMITRRNQVNAQQQAQIKKQQANARQKNWNKNYGKRRGGRTPTGRSRNWAHGGNTNNAYNILRVLI